MLLFGIPDSVAVAALVVLGRPLHAPRKLSERRWSPSPGSTATGAPRSEARRHSSPTIHSAVVKWVMAQNVLGDELQPCNYDPLTGFYRDGCCNTGAEDAGVHTVCTRVTAEFLEFSASVGNDLSTPHPEFGFDGLRAGDQWCLCAPRGRRPSRRASHPRSCWRRHMPPHSSGCSWGTWWHTPSSLGVRPGRDDWSSQHDRNQRQRGQGHQGPGRIDLRRSGGRLAPPRDRRSAPWSSPRAPCRSASPWGRPSACR